jgi:acetyl-CoA C-acetyltransferase
MHSIAHAVERLRKQPDEYGLITGVGHLLTEYSIGIYSGREPEKAWNRDPQQIIQQRIDALESPRFCEKPEGNATVETYTVLHDSPDGEPHAVIIARLDSGERCLVTTKKGSDLPIQMEKEEFIGYKGYVTTCSAGPNIFS